MRLQAWLVVLLPVCLAGAAELRVGAAAVKITPPAGAPMAGYYFNRAAEGVHDDLYAKALVFDVGGERAALVACDVEGLPRPIIEAARKRIEAATGIAAGRVMISATHSHTGPVILGGDRYNLEGRMFEIATQYARDLPGMISSAVEQASKHLEGASVAAAVGREATLTFNRRFHMKDGSIGWNPGKLNPDVIRPAGPTDPDVPVVTFQTAAGAPLAAYVNYAMHLDTVGGMQYSADYPYTLSKLLAGARSPGLLTMFTIGCAGNLNHIDVKWADAQSGHAEAARIGTILAAEVLKTMRRAEAVPTDKLRVRSAVVAMPLQEVRPGELEWARKITPLFGKPDAAPFMDLVRAFRVEEVAELHGKPIDAEVQVIAIGDQLAWVGLPGEVFTELGMAIKTASPFRYTIVAELANGSPGYIANRKAYAEGAYEPVSARCGPGSGEMLVDAATRLLVEMKETR